jgi:hypothetical protein
MNIIGLGCRAIGSRGVLAVDGVPTDCMQDTADIIEAAYRYKAEVMSAQGEIAQRGWPLGFMRDLRQNGR